MRTRILYTHRYITQPDLERLLGESPNRSQAAREILESCPSLDEHGRVDFPGFCQAMLPQNADPNLAIKVAEYMSKSFV